MTPPRTLTKTAIPDNLKALDSRVYVLKDKFVEGVSSLSPHDLRGKESMAKHTLQGVLTDRFRTDAYLVTYRLRDEDGNLPRLRKAALPVIRGAGGDVVTDILFYDFDLPGHRAWKEGEYGEWRERLLVLESEAFPWPGRIHALYPTKHGARIVLKMKTALPVDQAEEHWLGLCRAFCAAGVDLDASCGDWTRLFRLPLVRRDGKDTVADVTIFDREPVSWSDAPREKKAPKTLATKINASQPSDEEALALLTDELKEMAKRRLLGRDAYEVIFEGKAIASKGSRNNIIHTITGGVASKLFGQVGAGAEQVYALLLAPVLELEPDQDWRGSLWRSVETCWGQELAKASAEITETVVDPEDKATWKVHAATRDGKHHIELIGDDGAVLVYDRIDPKSSTSRRRVAKKAATQLGKTTEAVEGELLSILTSPEQAELSQEGRPPATIADRILELALRSGAAAWKDPSGDPHLTFIVKGVWRHAPLRSRIPRMWLMRLFAESGNGAAGPEAVKTALDAIESRALFDGDTFEAPVRLAGDDEVVWIDLAGDAGRAVEVSKDGWTTKTPGREGPRFIRPRGLLELAEPAPLEPEEVADVLESLWRLVPVEQEDRALVLGWMLGVLRPRGPYLHLSIDGPQGSAKSSSTRAIRYLLDPSALPLRAVPKDEDALIIAAKSSRIIALDNISTIPRWLSDSLCRLSTGGGISKRKLHTDGDEVIFRAQRPAILNGIGAPVSAPDLLDRCVSVRLAAMPETERRRERDLCCDLDALRPKILALLLDGVALALRRQDSITFEALPRMADAAAWVEAGGEALGLQPGEFSQRLREQRSQALISAIDANPVGPAILALLKSRGRLEGSASDILTIININRDDRSPAPRGWPATPRGLSAAIDRLEPGFTARGYRVVRSRQRNMRSILIERRDGHGEEQ